MQEVWCYKRWKLQIGRYDYVNVMNNRINVSLGTDAAVGIIWVWAVAWNMYEMSILKDFQCEKTVQWAYWIMSSLQRKCMLD